MAWLPGLLTVFFAAEPPHDLGERHALRPRRATARGAGRCSTHGVYPPPSQFEAWFPSLAHSREQIERTLAAARAAFDALAEPAVAA